MHVFSRSVRLESARWLLLFSRMALVEVKRIRGKSIEEVVKKANLLRNLGKHHLALK